MKVCKLEGCFTAHTFYVKFASWKSASWKFVLWKFADWKFASPHTHVLKVYVMIVCKLEVCSTAHTF